MTHEVFLLNFYQWKVLVGLERESLKEETKSVILNKQVIPCLFPSFTIFFFVVSCS